MSKSARSAIRPWHAIIALVILAALFFLFLAVSHRVVLAAIATVVVLVTPVAFQIAAVRHGMVKEGRGMSLTEIALRKITGRPRKVMTLADYEHLRQLERELGWEPSEPMMPVKARPIAGSVRAWHEELTAKATGKAVYSREDGECRLCSTATGYRDNRACGECEQELRRAKLRAARPSASTKADTTSAATVDQYVRWLRGYVKNGGKVTRWYDYPFDRAGFRYAGSTVTIDSDYEYGARLRNIIVARNVETKRTRPTAHFGGWAHTHCYWMHGYRTNTPLVVAAYSDPEFAEFRHDTPAPAAEHFAALANVGREYCPSYCQICARRLLGSMRYDARLGEKVLRLEYENTLHLLGKDEEIS